MEKFDLFENQHLVTYFLIKIYIMKNLLCLLFIFLLVSCSKEEVQDVGTQDNYFHIRNVDGSVATEVEPELMNPIYEHMLSLGMKAEAEKFLVTYTAEGTLIPQISELNFEGRSTAGAQSNSPVALDYEAPEQQPLTTSDLEASDRNGFNYGGHNQNIGWLYGFDTDVDTDPFFYELGTTGQSRRLEAYFLILYNYTLCYQSHIEGIGWQSSKCNGQITGTTGQSKRMEATRIWLSAGPTAGFVGYQAHIQNIGWQPWVFNGAEAGTTGQSLRLEAFRVKFYLF